VLGELRGEHEACAGESLVGTDEEGFGRSAGEEALKLVRLRDGGPAVKLADRG